MAVAAGLAALAGTLTRYEGWFLVPFVTLYFLFAARRRRLLTAAVFSILAILGPLAWLAHNWYLGDFLAFYRGPYAPKAIQGAAAYPGDHNWALAWLQFQIAARRCVGPAILALGVLGALGALLKRESWPLVLLTLPPVFYVWSIHSGGTPIFVPGYPYPFSYYNTRYGLAVLPLAAFAASALVAWAPLRLRAIAAVTVIGIGIAPWLLDPNLENCITWKESEINSHARRAWTSEAAEFLRANYRPGSGIFTTFGDVTGIFQQAGIPLRDTLTWDNWPHWPAAVARPNLFLREEWAVAFGGDPVQSAINRAFLRGPRYTLQKTIMVKGAPVVEIYRRDSQRGLAAESR